MTPLHSPRHRAVALLCASTFVFLLGCGGGPREAANSVSGNVTVKGEKVSTGTIIFHGSKDVQAPILEGAYKIDDPPLGQVKVSFKSLGGTIAGVDQSKMPKGPDKGGGTLAGAATGVAIPKKYEAPDNGTTYEVQAGKQKKDFDLQ